MQVFQVFPMMVQVTRFVPPLGNTGIVLPFVEEGQMLLTLPVHYFQTEVLVEFGDIPTICYTARCRLRLPDGMAGVDWCIWELVRDGVVLREGWIAGDGTSEERGCAGA